MSLPERPSKACYATSPCSRECFVGLMTRLAKSVCSRTEAHSLPHSLFIVQKPDRGSSSLHCRSPNCHIRAAQAYDDQIGCCSLQQKINTVWKTPTLRRKLEVRGFNLASNFSDNKSLPSTKTHHLRCEKVTQTSYHRRLNLHLNARNISL